MVVGEWMERAPEERTEISTARPREGALHSKWKYTPWRPHTFAEHDQALTNSIRVVATAHLYALLYVHEGEDVPNWIKRQPRF